jgi:hypothetical protein
MRKLSPDASSHWNSETMKSRRVLLRLCAHCGVESAHFPIYKGYNPKRLLMLFFALAFSPAGLVLAIKSKTHKRVREI